MAFVSCSADPSPQAGASAMTRPPAPPLARGEVGPSLVIFKGFLPPRPSVAFLMEGNTAGLNADAGVCHGYAYVAA